MSLGIAVGMLAAFAGVAAVPITPDWNLLLNFTTEYDLDMEDVIDYMKENGVTNFIDEEEVEGMIQADVIGERMRMTASGKEQLNDQPPLPEPFWDARIKGDSEFMFDAARGFIVAGFRGSMKTDLGKFHLDYCVKLDIPELQKILGETLQVPSPAEMQQQIDQVKPQIEQQLEGMQHKDMTLDGENVAIFQDPSGDGVIVGLRHTGAPFGVGVELPKEGKHGKNKWKPALKFKTWSAGAGTIEELNCSASASTSAAEFVAHPEASRHLKVFDALVARLSRSELLIPAFASLPGLPSQLFAKAAAVELSAKRPHAGEGVWPVVALASVAAMVGGLVTLAALKVARKKSSEQDEPLLVSVA